LIDDFAARVQLDPNEICKRLVALALTEMDARFYPLITEMAEAMGGANPFPRCCVHVQTALQTLLRLRKGTTVTEPERLWFVVDTARAYLAQKGLPLRSPCAWASVTEATGGGEEPAPAPRTGEYRPGRRINADIVEQLKGQLGTTQGSPVPQDQPRKRKRET
jgi:hypothetical protein